MYSANKVASSFAQDRPSLSQRGTSLGDHVFVAAARLVC